jgi:TRAP-type C4-dicarboxylate transport system permease large subunit
VEETAIGVLPFLATFMIMLVVFCFCNDWVTWLPDFFYGARG